MLLFVISSTIDSSWFSSSSYGFWAFDFIFDILKFLFELWMYFGLNPTKSWYYCFTHKANWVENFYGVLILLVLVSSVTFFLCVCLSKEPPAFGEHMFDLFRTVISINFLLNTIQIILLWNIALQEWNVTSLSEASL